MFKQNALRIVLAALLLGISGCQTDKTPPRGVLSNELVTGSAKVEALDVATRRIVLQRPDGSILRFRVGDEVRNLAQVKVGDEVRVAYYESLGWEVKKPGAATPGAELSGSVDRARPGERPAGKVERELKLTATIASFNKNERTVTLRSPSGEMTTIKVKHPEHLQQIAVGDLIEVTYTEGVAVAVNPGG
jgi:hypothetical protein